MHEYSSQRIMIPLDLLTKLAVSGWYICFFLSSGQYGALILHVTMTLRF